MNATTLRYPRIAAQLYAEPWQILPASFEEICAAFEKVRSHPDSQAAEDPVGPYDDYAGTREYLHPQILTFGHIALARVSGTTGRGLSRLAMECGGFDTGLFRQQLKNVAEDPTVKILVIDFNSPGGMAAGNRAVADDIRAVADSGKRVIGYTGTICASAAYYMACACDELHADPDAQVGSISTICSGVDNSKEWEMKGRELKLFATGKFKATGMEGKAWTPEEEAMVWERIRAIDNDFKSYVTARRGLAPESMEGQWWYAQHAPAGIVDSTDFDSLTTLLETLFNL